ncbi:putative uncharacterized protein ENSP00000383309 [Homarus americanus]|uniref:putative uncharacterized protein ENSP00000383309 n=1 Tax=Homarus americanus TaxID=6706 RepID=UPI001C48D954|nr:putative uncharacterized protein ENSP00000383309 [Homarus americanus]
MTHASLPTLLLLRPHSIASRISTRPRAMFSRTSAATLFSASPRLRCCTPAPPAVATHASRTHAVLLHTSCTMLHQHHHAVLHALTPPTAVNSRTNPPTQAALHQHRARFAFCTPTPPRLFACARSHAHAVAALTPPTLFPSRNTPPTRNSAPAPPLVQHALHAHSAPPRCCCAAQRHPHAVFSPHQHPRLVYSTPLVNTLNTAHFLHQHHHAVLHVSATHACCTHQLCHAAHQHHPRLCTSARHPRAAHQHHPRCCTHAPPMMLRTPARHPRSNCTRQHHPRLYARQHATHACAAHATPPRLCCTDATCSSELELLRASRHQQWLRRITCHPRFAQARRHIGCCSRQHRPRWCCAPSTARMLPACHAVAAPTPPTRCAAPAPPTQCSHTPTPPTLCCTHTPPTPVPLISPRICTPAPPLVSTHQRHPRCGCASTPPRARAFFSPTLSVLRNRHPRTMVSATAEPAPDHSAFVLPH